jgi:hypothetical protein
MKVMSDLRMALSFSEKEIDDYEITDTDGRVTWNQAKEKPKEIELGAKATEIVKSALEKMDKEGSLTQQHLSLYEKFMEGSG